MLVVQHTWTEGEDWVEGTQWLVRARFPGISRTVNILFAGIRQTPQKIA